MATSLTSGTTTGMDLSGSQSKRTSSITDTRDSSTQEIVPYIGACVLAFNASSLKPDTVVYPYLNGLNWASYTSPGLPNSSVTDTSDHNIVYSTGGFGSQLKTNANGAIWGKFTIPAGMVATGQVRFGVVDANGAYIDEAKLQAAQHGYTGDCTTYAAGMFSADHILIHYTIGIDGGGGGGNGGPADGGGGKVTNGNLGAVGMSVSASTSSSSAAAAAGAAGGAGGGAGGVCFIANSLISMADGTTKKISEVVIGDRVYNKDKTAVNTVTLLEYSTGDFDLYTPISKVKPFATVDHPLYIDSDLYSISPKDTFDVYPWLGKTLQLSPAKIIKATGITVYNLWTDGDSTYIVNGYGTTTIIGDGGLMKNAYHLDVITHDQIMAMMSYFFKERNGKDLSYAAYLINKYVGKLNNNFITKVLTKILLNGKYNSPGKPLTIVNKMVHLIARKIGSIAWLLKNTK
jgi:hypothetical protein